MSTYFISSPHGCGIELAALLSTLSLYQSDTCVFLGDYFVGGSSPATVLKEITSLTCRCQVVTLMGNQEYRILRYLNNIESSCPSHYNLALNQMEPQLVCEFLQKINVLFIHDKVNGVHAGVIEEVDRVDIDMNIFGKRFWDSYEGDKLIVYSSLGRKRYLPRIRRNSFGRVNSVGIGTAVQSGGPMTAFSPQEFRFFNYSSGVDHWREISQKIDVGFIPISDKWDGMRGLSLRPAALAVRQGRPKSHENPASG